MVYAFDFDSTLSDYLLHELVIKLKKEKNEVWVVTMRDKNGFSINVMMPVLKKLNIPISNVIFCNNKAKYEYLVAINADVYIDNISDEFEDLKNYTSVVPLLWRN